MLEYNLLTGLFLHIFMDYKSDLLWMGILKAGFPMLDLEEVELFHLKINASMTLLIRRMFTQQRLSQLMVMLPHHL
jgi:hypothetical protein